VKPGKANLWIKSDVKKINIATSHDKDIDGQNVNKIPEDLQWARFVSKEEPKSFELLPTPSDRTLVIKPEAAFYLTN